MSNFGHLPQSLTLKQWMGFRLSQIYGLLKRLLNVVSFKHLKHK